MSFALYKMILIKMKVQLFLLMKICSQFTLQGVSLPSMSRNFFEHATKKPTPPAASSGTRSIFWTCFFFFPRATGWKWNPKRPRLLGRRMQNRKCLETPWIRSEITQKKAHDPAQNARPNRKRTTHPKTGQLFVSEVDLTEVGNTWGICTPRASKLYRARSRLSRSQFLQPNIRWKALAEIYTMHSILQLSLLLKKHLAKWCCWIPNI